MSFQEKILSKSNSYQYYKERNERLTKENESLKQQVKELKDVKNLREQYLKLYPTAAGFCSWNYINFFFRQDFEDRFKEVTKHLDAKSKHTYKWLFLRSMAISFITRETLYFDHELADQEKYMDFKLNHTGPDEVGGFKFTGDYNLHAFIDLNLNDEDLEFLKDKDIIDAGAFTGDTSLPLSKVTSKNVYAFEPFEESFSLLEKNIADNDIKNIIPVMKSLGDIDGERSLYLSGENVQGITSNPEIREYDTELKVQETTVDKFVEENNLDVGYITIDVEGAEMDLLNGAVNTIKNQKPILGISIYHKFTDFFEIIPWVANLNLGYTFEVIKEQPWPFLADTIVLCRPKY